MRQVYLEGTDGVGKSSIIEELCKKGITVNDRHRDVISRYMLFDVPMEKRVREYTELLKQDIIVIFLINNDKEELERRIRTRNKAISEFDLHTFEYNLLYKETYEYMQAAGCLPGNLVMFDMTGKTLEESVNDVYEYLRGTESL